MIKYSELEKIYFMIKSGDINTLRNLNIQNEISNIAIYLIDKQKLDIGEQQMVDIILRISNIAYNNTSLEVLPLDDGIYDQLLEIYKKYNPNYQIGAEPVDYKEQPQNDYTESKMMVSALSKNDIESKLYVKDLWKNVDRTYKKKHMLCVLAQDPITKRMINTKHSYPELVGTLDKCKFVLNHDAKEKDVFDKQSVKIFERDFIQNHLQTGIIYPAEIFEMVAELKYDGVSVEAEVYGDSIISARSRGDTAEDIATDLTPIFGGYKFERASKSVEKLKKLGKFGIKFEAVITKRDLEFMGECRGKTYKNCRNAIIGLLGASDSYRFKDLITLIPLSTSLDIPRIDELNFLNNFYSSGEFNRFKILRGNYQQILFQVKQFVESAEIVRKILPYLIDGTVISYIDPEKIAKLGRQNSVNKYSIAIKFNPRKVRTIFLGYTFSIGKTGDIIPMVHFKPVEFMGNIQTKQTLHSYNRFVELGLRKGSQIDIDYVNDVLTYVTKPDTEYNRKLDMTMEPEPFIDTCPSCGSNIIISDSGKSAKCVNYNCKERNIMRVVDMINILGFKTFSEETVRTLNISSFRDLMNVDYERAAILGPVNANNFIDAVNSVKNNPIEDHKIMTAMCFDGIGTEKWKIILKVVSINDIIFKEQNELRSLLINIQGISDKTVDMILECRNVYADDLNIISRMSNIVSSFGSVDKPKIAFTGERDQLFIELLNNSGFDASDKYSVTKNTFCLITNDKNSTSGKMKKAQKNNIPIYTKQEFIELKNIKI